MGKKPESDVIRLVERENMKKQEMLHVVCAVVVSVVSRFAGIRMESSLVDA